MTNFYRRFCLIMFCLIAPLTTYADDKPGEPAVVSPSTPERRLEFQLTGLDGQPVVLTAPPADRLTVICFLGTECPLAKHYGPRLSRLAEEFKTRGVRFVALNSNSQDTTRDVREFVKAQNITIPMAKDPANQVADLFGATRMSEVFVVDQQSRLRYQGRVDDQYLPGLSRSKPSREDLRIALEELLADKEVSVPQTATPGCVIGRVKTPAPNATVTYCNQVARILNQHCVECHRPGEIGPFSLTEFEDVQGWGDTMLEVIDNGRMPPWNANPDHGSFGNARLMPEADKQTLRDWVQAGMPYGDAQQLPEPLPAKESEWQLTRQPDLILPMRDRPFQIPATGTVEYQYFVVDPQFTEDKWISGAQVIPGNRGIVHHCILFVRPPDGSEFRGVGWLTGYVPGQRSSNLPAGYARKVPAGSKLVFQMHYTPNGTEQADLSKVGMTFTTPESVTHEVYTLLGIDQEFEIPPFADNHPVRASLKWLPERAELLAIIPHMHVRGRSIEVVARRGDQTETLLDVPRYDFNWQHVYELTQPLPLSELDGLEFTARFDNSPRNPANPDPSQTVTWGDQTWEEMAITFFEVAEPVVAGDKPAATRQRKKTATTVAAEEELITPEETTQQFFARFDKNRDGLVEELETPLAFRKFGFRQMDHDQDRRLTREEVLIEAQWSARKRRR